MCLTRLDQEPSRFSHFFGIVLHFLSFDYDNETRAAPDSQAHTFGHRLPVPNRTPHRTGSGNMVAPMIATTFTFLS